jgi:rod shape-determining protein MreB
MKLQFLSHLSKKIGIDLGTSQVRIWSDQDGYVVDEPCCIAVDTTINKVIAVGKEAQEMIGRIHEHIQVFHPVQSATITDPAITEAMLRVFLQKIFHQSFFFRPLLMVSVPSSLTEPEKIALTDVLFSLGVREVNFIDQVLAAAIGSGVPIADASGSFLFQIGAGVVEAGIISLGSLVAVESLAEAGDSIDLTVQRYLRQEHQINVGIRTAERVKIQTGSLLPKPNLQVRVTGQDVLEGVPKEVMVSSQELRPLLVASFTKHIGMIKKLFEHIPPELTTDIIDKGILLSGGMARLKGLDSFLVPTLGVPVAGVDEPDKSVIKGIAQVLQNLELFRESVGYRHAAIQNG